MDPPFAAARTYRVGRQMLLAQATSLLEQPSRRFKRGPTAGLAFLQPKDCNLLSAGMPDWHTQAFRANSIPLETPILSSSQPRLSATTIGTPSVAAASSSQPRSSDLHPVWTCQ